MKPSDGKGKAAEFDVNGSGGGNALPRSTGPTSKAERSREGLLSGINRQAVPRDQTAALVAQGSSEDWDSGEVGTTSEEEEGWEPKAPLSATNTMDGAQKLNQYREHLARDLAMREMSVRGVQAVSGSPRPVRVSPIIEEEGSGTTSPPPALRPVPTPYSSEPTTTSTESGNTIKGGITPGIAARTPSYPFPRMTPPAAFIGSGTHRPFTTLSPTPDSVTQHVRFGNIRLEDKVLSNPSTPASTMTFLPGGFSFEDQSPNDLPTPNLYDLSLMLSAEPGLDAWWNTVVQIMTEVYHAERVTLSVPADSTDIENVPWGQKATYNTHHEDELSMGYMARGSSLIPSSGGDFTETPSQKDESLRSAGPSRPSLQSRHSFTSYEDRKVTAEGAARAAAALRRPVPLPRSKSSYPTLTSKEALNDLAHMELNQRALQEHDALEEQQQPVPAWEAPFVASQATRGKILPVLQALDYEADPLIDHNGVQRVLDRGKVIALTRNYPYLEQLEGEASKLAESSHAHEKPKKRFRKHKSGSTPKLSSLLGGAKSSAGGGQSSKSASGQKKSAGLASRLEDDEPRPPTPKYEEYEQAPPSPWSQSPAPSPAVRQDPEENPFFTDAIVDEESFNPGSAPADYSAMQPPETIGVDNSWTVLHIPLSHVLLSKPNLGFRLDPTLMDQKSNVRGRESKSASGAASAAHPSPNAFQREKITPIAILSILSPIIPYPSNLRYSLEHLAPHLATSFSLCRHYTNLETELNGLQKRRPTAGGFGGLGPDGRPFADPATLQTLGYLPGEDMVSQRSLAGSITSPSDYSGPSRSTAGSPNITPNWDANGLAFIVDKRPSASSPAPMGGDSYFNSKPKGKTDTSPAAGASRARRNSKDANAEKRSSLRLSGGKASLQESGVASPTVPESSLASTEGRKSIDEPPVISVQQVTTPREKRDSLGAQPVGSENQKKTPGQGAAAQSKHTQLHSYGADFQSTFQSLPPSSVIGSKGIPQIGTPARAGSVSVGSGTEMTPPSDRLKGLILDSLPAHVFVALPQTGEIVWVNSRFLTYRGQTSETLAVDPWGSIHADDREEYLRAWSHSVRTGEQFSRTVRIRRFDGAYRWFYARAVASKDKRGVILQFLGSYMDIHDQHIAELRAARQEEIEASEAKHRLLANLIPQIIFTATEEEGITFANEQWLSYTGQSFDDALGLGFMDYVHPEDLAKCRIPVDRPLTPLPKEKRFRAPHSPSGLVATPMSPGSPSQPDLTFRGVHHALSRQNSSSSDSVYELPTANLTELARNGVIKVATDSSGRLSYTTEIRLRSKNGEYRWHLIRCVEIDNIDFGNGASSYFGSATDINDHKLLEAKLKEAMDSKGRFLSNMSHEIRTPLIGISGMVSFLQDTTLNEEQRDYTNTIQTSANSLLMIINDILDLSKVDAGMMKLNHEWFHTRSLIEDVNELVSTMAIAKRLELNYVVEADVPAWVKGDKVRIRQVLLNVIGNAIKFTTEGEVFSHCRIFTPEDVRLGEHEIMLEFSVVDTGRGFSKDEAELIFKPFSQIDGSSTRQHGGSGLGLVISRQLVELHGGTMDGTAVPGKGSTFTFTARFGLPSDDDHPDTRISPQMASAPLSKNPAEEMMKATTTLPPRLPFRSPTGSPATADTEVVSPALASSGSSDPSLHSGQSHATARSSMSSINAGLVHFSQAARVSGQDLSQMKLEMPSDRSSETLTPVEPPPADLDIGDFRPPMYSILVISPQTHSREATTKHIEMTLPKDIPHQITALASVTEASKLITGDDPVIFTHIVVNLPSPEELVGLMDEITKTNMIGKAIILILSDSVQRQAVMKMVSGTKYEELLSESKVTYIYKPVKPSRFAVIFDPAKERDLSIDHNRSTAQRLVESQKQSYVEMEKRMGNKGYKVLLVEDNLVNQKVLQKYLRKVGIDVDVAGDGVECTEKVFAKPHDYYSLILCDLHMPRKDGYQTCQEIRNWENATKQAHMPIIALSANVMSDVQEKCVAAGFSDYITKPVDFIDLSNALSKFF